MARGLLSLSFEVHPDEAVEQLIHHLKIAATLFEAVPTAEQVKEEARRIMSRETGEGDIGGVLNAMHAFVDALDAWYEEDRKRYPDHD